MTINLALLGDSIGYGQGASSPKDTIGPRLAATLAAAGTPTQLRVFAVPGAVSAGLAAQVTRALPWRPDVAVVVVGANDVTHLTAPQQAASQLAAAVRALRAGGAQVVVAPAPDLSVVPWVPAPMRAAVRASSALLRQAQTSVALAEGARVANVDTRAVTAFAADPGLFSADRFHPSSAGYALIAAALTPAVLAAADDVAARRS